VHYYQPDAYIYKMGHPLLCILSPADLLQLKSETFKIYQGIWNQQTKNQSKPFIILAVLRRSV